MFLTRENFNLELPWRVRKCCKSANIKWPEKKFFSGLVRVQVKRPTMISSIMLSIEGYAKTKIVVDSGDASNNTYTSKEHFLKGIIQYSLQWLLSYLSSITDSLKVSDGIQLEANWRQEAHGFPFVYNLYHGLPSTFLIGKVILILHHSFCNHFCPVLTDEDTGFKYFAVAKAFYSIPQSNTNNSCLFPIAICNPTIFSTVSSERAYFNVFSPVSFSDLTNPWQRGALKLWKQLLRKKNNSLIFFQDIAV